MTQFTNKATISYNGVVVNSNIVTGEITQEVNVSKDATVNEYNEGDILTYVVSIQNSGTTNYDNLTLTDNLGAYAFGTSTLYPLTYTGDPVLYYINGTLQTPPTVTAGPPLVITGIDLPAGQSSVIIFRATVNSFAPLSTDGKIKNVAEIRGNGITDRISAEKTVPLNPDANLTIIKSLNPMRVVENGRIVYTFTIQNNGITAADVDAEIVIEDTFKPVLNLPLTVTLNGDVWPQVGNYIYNPSSGEFSTVEEKITVEAAKATQDQETGEWSITPGVTVLTVSGNI